MSATIRAALAGGVRGPIAQQYGDYRFVRVDRTSLYVVTVARRPRRSGMTTAAYTTKLTKV